MMGKHQFFAAMAMAMASVSTNAGPLDRQGGDAEVRVNPAANSMLRVPGVLGLHYQQATQLLQQVGLNPQLQSVTQEDKRYAGQEELVVSQSPSAGGVAMIGSSVTVVYYLPSRPGRDRNQPPSGGAAGLDWHSDDSGGPVWHNDDGGASDWHSDDGGAPNLNGNDAGGPGQRDGPGNASLPPKSGSTVLPESPPLIRDGGNLKTPRRPVPDTVKLPESPPVATGRSDAKKRIPLKADTVDLKDAPPAVLDGDAASNNNPSARRWK